MRVNPAAHVTSPYTACSLQSIPYYVMHAFIIFKSLSNISGIGVSVCVLDRNSKRKITNVAGMGFCLFDKQKKLIDFKKKKTFWTLMRKTNILSGSKLPGLCCFLAVVFKMHNLFATPLLDRQEDRWLGLLRHCFFFFPYSFFFLEFLSEERPPL